MAPIRVRGRFATAYDTAKALGVSRSRTEEFIDRARTLVNGGDSRKERKTASRAHGKRKASSRRAPSGR